MIPTITPPELKDGFNKETHRFCSMCESPGDTRLLGSTIPISSRSARSQSPSRSWIETGRSWPIAATACEVPMPLDFFSSKAIRVCGTSSGESMPGLSKLTPLYLGIGKSIGRHVATL